MSLETKLIGNNAKGKIIEQSFTKKVGLMPGAIVYTDTARDLSTIIHFFTNPDNAIDMAVNGSFGTVSAVINDGGTTSSADSGTTDGTTANKLVDAGKSFTSTTIVGMPVHNTTDDTYATVTAVDSDTILSLSADIMTSGENYVINPVWPGTAIQGDWDFADGGTITLTNGNNGDQASLDANTLAVYSGSDFAALSGKVTLSDYNENNNSILMNFTLNGSQVGSTFNLNNLINTSSTEQQPFSATMEGLGLSNETFNDLTISLVRTGGPRPDIIFDDLQLESTGGFLYKASPTTGTRVHLEAIRFVLVNNVTEAVMQGYDKFGGQTSLTNGIVLQRVRDGKVEFSATLKQLSDFLLFGANTKDLLSDGTNTTMVLEAVFTDPLIMEQEDFLAISITDDLSDLVLFSVSVIGGEEQINGNI